MKLSKAGYTVMSESSVIICGIARDCSIQLNELIPKLENLGARFKDYKIIIVENDSRDDTGNIISSWATENTNVLPIIFSENDALTSQDNSENKAGDFGYSRISRITYARNLYLSELEHYESIDFVIVIDMDILDFSIPGIANSFGQLNRWDCATSSGLRYTLRAPLMPSVYWDTFAYEPEGGFVGGIQSLVEIRSNQKKLKPKLRDNELVQALSAFGGMAIYKYESLRNQRYEVLTNSDSEVRVLCEHVALHRSINRANRGFRLVINPMQELRYESPLTTIRRSLLKFRRKLV